MASLNRQGQILIEVSLVMLLIVTILFGAMTQLSNLKSASQKYQFTKDPSHAAKSFRTNKK